MHVLPTYRQLLAGNQQLPGDQRQSMVMIRFAQPVPRFLAWEFMRLHMTRPMLTGGEPDFYQVEIGQPHKLAVQTCPRCRTKMQPIGPWLFTCRNAACKSYGRTHNMRPVRGVVRVLIPGDAVRHADGRELIDKLVLVLDRRYHEVVLSAVYRTAGELADLLGVKIR